jgi:hypothetical protein
MAKKYTLTLVFLATFCSFITAKAQNNFFKDEAEQSFITADQKRAIIPQKYRTIQMDLNAMKSFLLSVPRINEATTNRNTTPIISIPMPDGSTALFHIWERSIMEPGLEAKYPNIKTYTGQGITDRTAVIVASMTEFGFNAMILSSVTGNVFIDPYDFKTTTNYISYYKKDFHKDLPYVEEGVVVTEGNTTEAEPAGQCVGPFVRTYRLALGCNTQYAVAATGLSSPTKAQALAKMVISVNRVTGVYETEVGIRLVLVANTDNIIFVTQSGDPYYSNNSNGSALLGINQTQCDNLIGSANYDIGHVFSTGGGGIAGLGVVCSAGNKARGVTGSSSPVGDAYDIDYVAHEMGHQFKGNHTFNATTGSCGGGNRSGSTACEPGSGITIMAYAGICGSTNDLAAHSIPTFHAVSQAEIMNYSINSTGNSCAVTTATGNSAPVVNVGTTAYRIPISTPFALTGTATDIDGNTLTYSWEQRNTGAAAGDWNGTQNYGTPLFRSFVPQTTGTRYFPQLSDVVYNTTTKGERLPTVFTDLNMRLTVRDNVAGGGGVCFGDVTVTADNSGGPFLVTYPNNTGELWYEGQTKTITWDKANTDIAPFNVTNVEIALSTDGGFTYPTILLASTPNDGSENIVVPYGNQTYTGRIRVRALGNIFYDISNNNITISPNPVPVKWISFTGEKIKNNAVKLYWDVNEIDNHIYFVERSLDGQSFSAIGEVAASTAPGNLHSYNFTDTKPFASTNYYRLKQVDKNGNYSYSNIIVISFDESIGGFVVYPNPTTEFVNLFSNANYNKLQVNVYDAIGKLVYTQNKQSVNKGEIIKVPLTGFAKGVYSIKVEANNTESIVKKVIVQ